MQKQANNSDWIAAFEGLTVALRRWAFVSAKMAEHGKTFKGIATKHRLGHGYLAECCQGAIKGGSERKLTAKMKSALEIELKIDLSPFLTEREAWNMMKARNLAKAKKGDK